MHMHIHIYIYICIYIYIPPRRRLPWRAASSSRARWLRRRARATPRARPQRPKDGNNKQ